MQDQVNRGTFEITHDTGADPSKTVGSGDLELKEEVLYVRCRRRIKKMLLLRMGEDRFESMADWFDQWVPVALAATAKVVKNKKNSRKSKKAKKTKKRASSRKSTKKDKNVFRKVRNKRKR